MAIGVSPRPDGKSESTVRTHASAKCRIRSCKRTYHYSSRFFHRIFHWSVEKSFAPAEEQTGGDAATTTTYSSRRLLRVVSDQYRSWSERSARRRGLPGLPSAESFDSQRRLPA